MKEAKNSVLVPTNGNQTIQIGEIIEIISPKTNVNFKSSHWIESELISYPSYIHPEDQINLEKFLFILAPVVFIGLSLCVPSPAFASEKIKQRAKSSFVSDFESLNKIGKENGFKVVFPSAIREKMAFEARKIQSGGKRVIGRRLVEKAIKRTSSFNPKFQDKEFLIPVLEPIIDKLIVINSSNTFSNRIEKSYLFLLPVGLGIVQLFDSEKTILTFKNIETIRGGALPAVLGWFSQAWGLKKNVEQVLNFVGGKKETKNQPNWTDFFPSESSSSNSNTNKNNKISSFLTQVTASGGSFVLIWYFLAIYNKSRREGKKLPVPEFILPDLVPEVRRVTFKEKLYNFSMKLIDLSTPLPYAIILLAMFIYFFRYAGKDNNPIENAFSFVNTLFQQLVKATETTQNYLAEEIKKTSEEAKNAQKELKEEHRLQREKLTEELNVCQNQISESVLINQYSGQVNHQLHTYLETCENRLAVEEEKTSITSRKIIQFKGMIKNEDGSFNEQKFDQVASEIQEVIHNDFITSKSLQKIQQRSEDRLLNIDRSLPPFPIKKVVEYNTPVNQFIDGLLNLFGIQTRPSEKYENTQIGKTSTPYENFSPINSRSPISHQDELRDGREVKDSEGK